MRILHFFPWTSWGSLGGTEKYIIEISNRHSLSHDVAIAFPSNDVINLKNHETNYREIVLNNFNPNSNRLVGWGIIPSSQIFKWIKLLRKENFDIIHFHCYEPYLLWLIIVCKVFQTKVVFTSHIVNFTCINGKLTNPKNEICDGKLIVKRCAECYMMGEYNKKSKFVSHFLNITLKKINISVLKYFLDLVVSINENYNDVLLTNGFQSKKLIVIKPMNFESHDQKPILKKFNTLKVIYTGRLSKLKGLDVLLDAFKELDEHYFYLDVYGSQSDLEVIEYNQKNVKYMGEFQFNETDRILQNYDVLCLPSVSYEMTPLSIIEAVNNGLFVIGTDVPGIRELIMNEGIKGKIVKRNSKQELINAFNELRNGFNDNSNNKFKSLETIADEIEKQYFQLL